MKLTDEQYQYLWYHRQIIEQSLLDRTWVGRFKKTVGYQAHFGTKPFNHVWKAFVQQREGKALKYLWDTTEAFFKRFNCYPPDESAQLRAYTEECREFGEEYHPDQPDDWFNGAQEANDVLVTMMGCLMARGVTYDQFEAALFGVAKKLDAKTDETHFVHPITGKITRRS